MELDVMNLRGLNGVNTFCAAGTASFQQDLDLRVH